MQEAFHMIYDYNRLWKPKRGIIKMALNTLKGIAGTVEFVAAVTA